MDDAEQLEKRLRNGDEKALATLFAMHRSRLWRMVNFRLDRKLCGRVDSEDVLQESYLAAARRIAHYAETAMSPFVWLRAIVNQTMIDLHRHHIGAQRRNVQKEVAINCATPQKTSSSIAICLAGSITSPSQAAVRAEMAAQLDKAIAEMDPIDQEILALRHFEELSNNEVAEVLGIQPKAASIRYIRAIRRLKGIMQKIPGFADSAFMSQTPLK